jgi:hypothetical protein
MDVCIAVMSRISKLHGIMGISYQILQMLYYRKDYDITVPGLLPLSEYHLTSYIKYRMRYEISNASVNLSIPRSKQLDLALHSRQFSLRV